MCDTSFLIRLLNRNDELHNNAKGYFKYFLQNEIIMKCSTIAIAEYCVKGKHTQLPLRNIQILPFNFNHALRAGELAAIAHSHRNTLDSKDRKIIPNDTKLFAQADSEEGIDAYITSDAESFKLYNLIREYSKLSFEFIDLKIPYSDRFGILPLDEFEK